MSREIRKTCKCYCIPELKEALNHCKWEELQVEVEIDGQFKTVSIGKFGGFNCFTLIGKEAVGDPKEQHTCPDCGRKNTDPKFCPECTPV
jgi:hypothetical protein